MTTFPMRVTKQTLDHQGGTKSYHFVFIRNNDGYGLLIKRWGKKGAFGQMEVLEGPLAEDIWRRTLKDKQKRGYSIETERLIDVNDLGQLKTALTPRVYTSIGAGALTNLIPGVDTTGVKDPEKIEWVENPDGSMKIAEKPIIKIEETIEDQIAANSKWGIF